MIRVVTILFSLLAVAGCATFGQMKEGLSALLGKDYHVAFDVLGYPSGTQEFGDTTVYTWINNVSGVVVTPQTSFNQGNIGGAFYQSTSTTNHYRTAHYSCKIQLSVDSSSRINRADYNGQLGACELYIHRLNDYLDKQYTNSTQSL